MARCKKYSFTLIELLLVISILLMVAGLVGYNIRRAFFEQRFRAEVSAVVDTLRLAQDLMLLLNSDAHVLFADDPAGGIRYWIEVEKQLSGGWERELKRKRPNLKAIHLVEMDDRISAIKVKKHLDIMFLSGGSVMSKGILRLFSSDEKEGDGVLKSYICLPGYPKPIDSSSTEIKECTDGKEAENADLLTRDMQNEIQPKLQKQASDASTTPVEESQTGSPTGRTKQP
ncbi:MAG: type II secretion system GspH family protein [Parachlamydia sp.]|nr:type II secretion system GspH family protein [Parachlamydia sp.]